MNLTPSILVQTLLHLALVATARERLLGFCGARLVSSVVDLLSKSQNEDVQTNAIGTTTTRLSSSRVTLTRGNAALLHTLATGSGVEVVRGSIAERSQIAKALRPRLLSTHEPLRALTMQVIARLCTDSPDTVAFYLEEGIAGT
jgi:hypothetical protein